jgi:hypothetical protein
MITVKASHKIFTCTEVASLTGICTGHLQNLVKRHRLGFISRTGTLENHAEQWFFTSHDLMVLAMLFQPCAH